MLQKVRLSSTGLPSQTVPKLLRIDEVSLSVCVCANHNVYVILYRRPRVISTHHLLLPPPLLSSLLCSLCPPVALQFREHEIDKRAADMYSFAVVIWEVGTGEVPYGGLPVMKVGLKASCGRGRLWEGQVVGGAVCGRGKLWEGQVV